MPPPADAGGDERPAKAARLDIGASNIIVQFQSSSGEATGSFMRPCAQRQAPCVKLQCAASRRRQAAREAQILTPWAFLSTAGPQLDIPQNVAPEQLEVLLNGLLQNQERLPYSFYIDDQELSGELGAHLAKAKISVEQVLRVVYEPQAVFRVRPVARCTASIPGHSEAVLSVNFSPCGR